MLSRNYLIKLLFICLVIVLFYYYKYKSDRQNKFNSFKSDGINIKLIIKKIMDQNTIDGINIITISNYGFRDILINWIISLQEIDINKFVIFSFDKKLYDYLVKIGYKRNTVLIPNDWLNFDINSDFAAFKNKKYFQIVQSKMNVFYNLILYKRNILFSDPDSVWLNKHILKYIKYNIEFSKAEILFSQDQSNGETTYNTGFFYAKPTKFVENLFLKTIINQKKYPKKSIDQCVLNDIIKKEFENDKRIIGLDHFLFATGNVFYINKLNQKFNIKPFFVHANYIKGKKLKIKMFKLNKLWRLKN